MNLASKGLFEADLGLLVTNKESTAALREGLEALEAHLAEVEKTFQELPAGDPSLAQQRLRLEYLAHHLDRLEAQVQEAISFMNGQQESTQPLSPLSQGESIQTRIIDAQENERRRLAREIHDGPAQVLANAIFGLAYCERLLDKDAAATKRELAHLEADLREGMTEVRRLIFDLHLPSLNELGLETTLTHYIQNYHSRFGITVQLELRDLSERLPPALEVTIFRVIQEALQNVQKHAAAHRVTIHCQRQGRNLVFTIVDDGRGFDPSQLTMGVTRHLGIVSMRERAMLVQGRLQIDSEPGKGTTVTFIVPYEPRGGERISE